MKKEQESTVERKEKQEVSMKEVLEKIEKTLQISDLHLDNMIKELEILREKEKRLQKENEIISQMIKERASTIHYQLDTEEHTLYNRQIIHKL